MGIPFRAITAFHATVSAGSVSAAARQLGVTPSAVSQQVSLLESYVGTALLLKVGRGLYIEGLAEERHWPITSPRLLPAGGIPAGSLAEHRLIHSVRSQVRWPQWFAAAGLDPDIRWRRVLFDRTHMAIDAAADGMGVALESDLMFWRDWRAGRLVCPVRAAPPPQPIVTQWIVCPRDKLHLSRVQSFLEWLRHERDLWLADVTVHPFH